MVVGMRGCHLYSSARDRTALSRRSTRESRHELPAGRARVEVRLEGFGAGELVGDEQGHRGVVGAFGARTVAVGELAACLIRSLPAAAAARDEVEGVLRAAIDRARTAWPKLAVADDVVVTAIGASVRDADDVIAAIGELVIDDLYLALACAAAVPAALSAFATTCDPALAGSLRQMGLAADVVDEVIHELHTKLFVGASPKIASYSGRAPLRSWARTVATRLAIDRMRARDTAISDDDEVLDRLPATDDSPELAHLRATYAAELKQAFEEALATLEVRERNVLRHHFVDRLSIDQIGALYGVHKTTAFRWLEAARTALAKRTRASFGRRVPVLPAELDSIVRLVQSHVDFSLSRVLA
jgi:RNA polymerase sigma-70 factor (ECF subfamily)